LSKSGSVLVSAEDNLHKNSCKTSSHAVFDLQMHVVFVTKYRRKVLTVELLAYLKQVFIDTLIAWRCHLVEFGGEPDHVHMLIEIHPSLKISSLINNLKTVSSRKARKAFATHLSAYYIGSVGRTSTHTIRHYIQQQGASSR